MGKLNLNEIAALNLIFEFISVKDLLVAAMKEFSNENNTLTSDNSDLCYKAIATFLK